MPLGKTFFSPAFGMLADKFGVSWMVIRRTLRGIVARVAFTANLQRHLSCPDQTVPGDTVRAVLDQVFAAEPRLRSYILDDQDRVRRHVAI